MDENEFHVDGVTYHAKSHATVGCDGCYFYHDKKCSEVTAPCCAWQRYDCRDVIFVEVIG